jgi:hypothetical protein
MDGKVWLRIFAGLVLLAAIAGIAVFAFNAGAATHIQLPAASTGQARYPYYCYPFWRPFPFFGFGFGCFGPLIALLLLFLAFRALSFLFWGPRWGWRHGMRRGWRHSWDDESGVPPMFREWHDRAHGQTTPPESKNE